MTDHVSMGSTSNLSQLKEPKTGVHKLGGSLSLLLRGCCDTVYIRNQSGCLQKHQLMQQPLAVAVTAPTVLAPYSLFQYSPLLVLRP